MTDKQLEAMEDWLRDEADRLKRDEPHAHETIKSLIEAANHVSAIR